MHTRIARLCFVAGLAIVTGACRSGAQPDATVTLDPSVQYQTIRGWSCNPHYLGGSAEQREQLIEDAVNNLGITRLRWQQPNGNRSEMRRWEWENDNGDPDDTDMSRLNVADADRFVRAYVLPFKQRVEANGDPFELWLSPSFFDGGSTGSVPAFLLHSPGEYAEYATSFMLYLKSKYGIDTNHYAICNEAGNHNAFKPAVVAEMTKVLGARMAALGLPTRGQFSDGINARVTWNYIQAAKDDLDVWKYVDVLSYHWYGKDNQDSMVKIHDFARQHGMDTAQTEFMNLRMDHLYDDLTIGGVSYWSIYGLGGPSPRQNYYLHRNGSSFSRGKQFWNFRQVMHYVRPGAVRIEAASSDPAIRALAFVHAGRTTVVLINTTPPHQYRTVALAGLPTGDYGVSQSVGTRPYTELGRRTVEADVSFAVDVPSNGVLTVYPHGGKKLPPTLIDWQAQPNYLTSPASEATLAATAQDPELDPLSYSWSVVGQPEGAAASLTDNQAATTPVTGLTTPGQYAFKLTVTDGANEVVRDVLLNVLTANQPPRLIDVHNRIPVLVTLPQDTTILIGGAHDLEDDPLTYHWSTVRQPPGGAANLETPDEQKCQASNITVPGDYVFAFEASDPTHTVSETLTVPVYPQNTTPVIREAKATPADIALPDAETSLSAMTSDPDGDVITHWWRVKSQPAGAEPAFGKQGGRDTQVTGLSKAGTYVFTLTVVDRTEFAQQDVAVTVRAAGASADAAEQPSDPPDTRAADDRIIIARGVVLGTVIATGRAWVEVRSDSGKVSRYIPEWRGGAPRDGGGPDTQVVGQISRLKAGDRVRVRWYVNDHLRVDSVQPLP